MRQTGVHGEEVPIDSGVAGVAVSLMSLLLHLFDLVFK